MSLQVPVSLQVAALNLCSPPPGRAVALLRHLAELDADLLVLSELAPGEGSLLLARALHESGHQVLGGAAAGGLGVLLAGRGNQLEALPAPQQHDLPGRVVCARTDGLTIAGVYGAASDPVRHSSTAQRERKRRWLTWFGEWLDGEPVDLVVGDLNIADPLVVQGLRYVLPEETALYTRLVTTRWADAYRLHQLAEREPSWLDHSGVGARYDHALVAAPLAARVTDCRLDRTAREQGLTDHSALLLRLG